MTTTTPDLFDGAFWRDSYPTYEAARGEHPVREVTVAGTTVWMLFRHADVRAALADPRLSKDWRFTLPAAARAGQPATTPMMILTRSRDGPTR